MNERIERAVQETRGLALASGGEFPYAWFHAHSGGMTAEAKEGLAYEKDEPAYTRVTEGREGESAPQEAKSWQAEFTRTEFLQAAKKAGLTGADGVKAGATSRCMSTVRRYPPPSCASPWAPPRCAPPCSPA